MFRMSLGKDSSDMDGILHTDLCCLCWSSVSLAKNKPKLRRKWCMAAVQCKRYYKYVQKLFKMSLGSSDEFELEFSGSSEPVLWRFRAELSRAGHFNFRAETELTILTICMSKNSKFFTYFPILLLYHDSNQFHDHLFEFMQHKGCF